MHAAAYLVLADLACKFQGCTEVGLFLCTWEGINCTKHGGCDGMFCEYHQASTSPAKIGKNQIRVCVKCAIDFREFQRKISLN